MQLIPRRIHCTSLALLATVCASSTAHANAPVIHENYKVIPSDDSIGGYFGVSTAIHNGIIAVSEPSFTMNPELLGVVYLFDAATGNQLNILVPGANSDKARLAWVVDIDDNFVVAGPGLSGVSLGIVNVFDVVTGSQIATLESPYPGSKKDYFGIAISIDQGIVAVSASWDAQIGEGLGAVYIYDASSGSLITELRPEEDHPDEVFGVSVALSDGIVAVGAIKQDPITFFLESSVYIFDATTGEQLHKLTVDQDGGYLGWAMAMEGTTLVASSLYEHNGESFVDAVYIFDIPTGAQIARIERADHVYHDYFGESVDISNGKIIVGASGIDLVGGGSGSTFLYDAATGDHLATLIPDQSMGYASIGGAVAIENGIVVGTGTSNNGNGNHNGTGFVFDISCPADLNNDNTLDLADINEFITALTTHNPIADFTNDGQFDFFDIAAFLTTFSTGCP